jgi:16S rRNA (adenine(1408)-N(1))-methyltransferase
VTVDVGTGDGKAVLRWARDDPGRLFIGVDANAAGMAASARRADRRKNGLQNAVFVLAAAESLPIDLGAAADRVTVQFPWGSLLRGILGAEGPVLANLALITKPRGLLTVVWSIVDRDRAGIGAMLAQPAETWFAAAGFDIVDIRPATVDEVAATGSTWAKRLGAGLDRPVTLLHAVRR